MWTHIYQDDRSIPVYSYQLLQVVIQTHDYNDNSVPIFLQAPFSSVSLPVCLLCVCLRVLKAVCHVTVEMRGVNAGSFRHDTPALNSLLLQEGTEESFSHSSSLPFLLPSWNMSLSSSTFLLSLYLPPLPLLPTSFIHSCLQHTHTEAQTPKWPLTSLHFTCLPTCSLKQWRQIVLLSPYPTVPPCSHPLVHEEKKHSTTAWRSSSADAKRARCEAQACSASLKPCRPEEFLRSNTNTRPVKRESRDRSEKYLKLLINSN